LEWSQRQGADIDALLKPRALFAFARLWSAWANPETKAETVSCAIVTCATNDLIRQAHERMPVLLRRDQEAVWLDPALKEPSDLLPLLQPYPADQMELYAVFSGEVSLENNGGFSSLQYYFDPIDMSACRTAVIRLKGDGKRHQFLVEAERDARHYLVYEFETGVDWQTVEIPLAERVPACRGDRLDIPNFPGQILAQVRFFIANRKAESLRLEIDGIWLR